MKALISSRIFLSILTLFISAEISAQAPSDPIIASYNEERPMPKFIVKVEAPNNPDVSTKALLSFHKNFGNVANVKWSVVENKYMAQFTFESRRTRVLFGKNGQIVYTISQGTVKSLPADTRRAVRSVYYDYDITMATEVQSLDKKAWFISLEDETSIITIRVMDGEITETGNYRKSK
jgi:hypothetical protein